MTATKQNYSDIIVHLKAALHELEEAEYIADDTRIDFTDGLITASVNLVKNILEIIEECHGVGGENRMTDKDYEWRLGMWDYHSLRNYVCDAKQKANDIIKSLDNIRIGLDTDVYALRDLVRELKQYADDAWVKVGEIVYDKESEE